MSVFDHRGMQSKLKQFFFFSVHVKYANPLISISLTIIDAGDSFV